VSSQAFNPRFERTPWLAVWQLSRGYQKQVAIGIALVFASSLMVMQAARWLGILVEQLGKGSVFKAATWYLCAEFISIVLLFLGKRQLAKYTSLIALSTRQGLFGKLRDLPMSYFDREPAGRLLTRLTNDVEGIEDFFGGTLSRVLAAVIQIVVVLIGLVVLNPEVGRVALSCTVPVFLFIALTRTPIVRALWWFKSKNAYVNARLSEFIRGLPTLRALRKEQWATDEFGRDTADYYNSCLHVLNWNSFVRPMIVLLATIPIIAVCYYGSQAVWSGTVSLGVMVALLRLTERFMTPIRTLSQEIQVIQEALTSAGRVQTMLSAPDENETLGVDGSYQEAVQGRIEFRNIYFSYDSAHPVLQGISFQVGIGQKVALVGETGSGKTSIANLIARLYPYECGDIFIDQVELRQWRRANLRQQIGYLTQDVVLHAGTILENLNVEGNDIEQDLRSFGLWDFFSRWPLGLNHQLSENGSNLSAGERQLIGFAKLALARPKIVLLDEATASLDTEWEATLQRIVHSAFWKDITCIVIAHRLSTIKICDHILVLKNGSIVERGSYEELQRTGSYFQKLLGSQT
jgi:ABC-type multidrug transport system fused ATPase/permease subunit